MRQQLVEVVQRGALDGVGAVDQLGLGRGLGSRGQIAVAVVGSIDPDGLEDRAELLDLSHEVLGGETTLTELPGQGVRRRDDGHSALRELGEQPRDQHRVAGIVELELVDAQHAVVRELLERLVEAESTDHVGEFDERAERLGLGNAVVDRGEQVSLADAEAAVEVQACTDGRGLLAEETALALAADLLHLVRELLGLRDRRSLRRLLGVGNVRGETDVVEHRRRDHLRDQLIGGDHGISVDKACGHLSSVTTWSDLSHAASPYWDLLHIGADNRVRARRRIDTRRRCSPRPARVPDRPGPTVDPHELRRQHRRIGHRER